MTETAPVSMPAMAPDLVVRFQYRLKSVSGPNEAPRPAQAYETTLKMIESSLQATAMPKSRTQASVMRLTMSTWLSVASFLKTPRKMFSATDEPVISRYDEALDIEAARMPETTRPQRKPGSMTCDRKMKMLSAPDWVRYWAGKR